MMAVLLPGLALVRDTTGHDWYAAGKVTLAQAIIASGLDRDAPTQYRTEEGEPKALTRYGMTFRARRSGPVRGSFPRHCGTRSSASSPGRSSQCSSISCGRTGAQVTGTGEKSGPRDKGGGRRGRGTGRTTSKAFCGSQTPGSHPPSTCRGRAEPLRGEVCRQCLQAKTIPRHFRSASFQDLRMDSSNGGGSVTQDRP